MPTSLKRALSGNFLTRYAERVIITRLPRSLKRMVYVTSALAVVLEDRSPSTAVLGHLNRTMKLGYQPTSMLFPAWISRAIWWGKEPKMVQTQGDQAAPLKRLSDQAYWQLAKEFALKCPVYLTYGSTQLMAYDIHAMLVASVKDNTLVISG